jgi:hypothetical protein
MVFHTGTFNADDDEDVLSRNNESEHPQKKRR